MAVVINYFNKNTFLLFICVEKGLVDWNYHKLWVNFQKCFYLTVMYNHIEHKRDSLFVTYTKLCMETSEAQISVAIPQNLCDD